jgi:hypothetical protein
MKPTRMRTGWKCCTTGSNDHASITGELAVGSEQLFGSGALVFCLLTIVYVLVKKYIEKKEKSSRPETDEEVLASIATARKCSEHHIFQLAGIEWQVSVNQVEDDFKRYLTHGQLPHYVRDYIRKNRPDGDDGPKDITSPGGNLPASWSA